MNPDLHLTPEQVDDLLLGDLAPAAAAHLAACGPCQALVAESEAPLAAFRTVSLAWAERRSATLPVPAPAQTARPSHRLAWASLTAAATAAIALAISVPLLHHPAPAVLPQPATIATLEPAASAPASSISASTDEIARDNAMLAAVDNALNSPAASRAGFGQTTHHGPMRTNLLQQER